MVVIADDLTGANDTAIQYRKFGVSCIVNVGLPGAQTAGMYGGYDLVSVNTDSRALSPSEAYDAVLRACRDFCCGSDARVYKKIDSVLRGNPGAELQAVLDALGRDLAFVAPAYPANGRVIRNGMLTAGKCMVDAVKSLSVDIKSKVVLVPLETVRGGSAAMEAFVAERRRQGGRVFLFDTESDDDLHAVYDMTCQCRDPFVLCGSAGLARFDAEHFSAGVSKTAQQLPSGTQGTVLVMTGSRNSETRSQVQRAAAEYRVPLVIMDKKLVEQHDSVRAVADSVSRAAERIQAGDKVVLICISSLFEDFSMVLRDSAENYRTAYELSECLGKIASQLFDAYPIKGIVSNGGDTTMQLCRQFGAYGIEPVDEVQPGTPAGILCGGKAGRLPVVTKSGGFGDEKVVTDSIRYLEDF